MAPTSPTLTPESLVTLRVDEPFEYFINDRKVRVRPNVDVVMPFDHLVYLAGSPFSTGRERLAEVRHIRGQYGFFNNTEAWNNRPKLRFYDESGAEISTPYSDPDGTLAPLDGPVDPQFMAQELDRLRKRQAFLENQLGVEDASRESIAASEATVDMSPNPVRERTATDDPIQQSAKTTAPVDTPPTADAPPKMDSPSKVKVS